VRFVSYLSPGLPEVLFESVVEALGMELSLECSVEFDRRASGPAVNEPDPFAEGSYDGGFVCTPPLMRLTSIDLAGAGLVFDDPRAQGRPVYFADVVARPGIRDFDQLRGGVWAYNDAESLSGYYSMLLALRRKGFDTRFFRQLVASGSHFSSIEMVARGAADAASIDSQTLRLWPDLASQVRVIDTWGPFPTHPVVLRSGLDPELKVRIREALLGLRLDCYGVHFRPIDEAAYAPLLKELAELA
jgi:phosphonate transport system substrate-binding protein